jgi:hypothetical protein
MAKRVSSAKGKQPRRGIIAFVSIFGLGTLFGIAPLAVQKTLAPSTPPAPTITVAEYDSIELPVPIEPIPAGTAVGKITFQRMRYPKHQVPENAVTDITSLSGAVAIAQLPANLPLFRNAGDDASGRCHECSRGVGWFGGSGGRSAGDPVANLGDSGASSSALGGTLYCARGNPRYTNGAQHRDDPRHSGAVSFN